MKYLVIGSATVFWLALGVAMSSLAGCGPIPPICGNGIIEGSEQCDNPSDPLCLPCCKIASGTCVTDNQCPSGEYCDQSSGSGVCNLCGPACLPFTSCGPGLVCTIGGVCGSVQCTTDADCVPLGSGLVCTGGRCLPSPACSAVAGATCSTGTCPPGQACVTDATGSCGCQTLTCDMVAPSDCASTLCSDGTACIIDAIGACACAPPPTCDTVPSSDCDTTLCSDGTACVIDAAGLCACASPVTCDTVPASDCDTTLCSDGTACVIDGAGLCACASPVPCDVADPTNCSSAVCPTGVACVLDTTLGVCQCPTAVACDVADPADCASATCPTGESCVLDPTVGKCRCDAPLACDLTDPANCGAGSCGAGTICQLDATGRCACSLANRGIFQYGVAPNATYSVGLARVGESAVHELHFDVTVGELETLRAVLTYPPEFGFNGFLSLGPANTQVGSFTVDLNFDGTPELTIPVRSLSDTVAYADLNPDGTYASYLEPTIEHTGTHVLTATLPNGGDGNPATLTSPASLRMGLVLLPGIFTNPAVAGQYLVTGDFTSIDPDTGGFDDAANNPPLTHSTNLPLTIVEVSNIPTVSEWGLMVLAIVLLTVGTIVIGRQRRTTAS